MFPGRSKRQKELTRAERAKEKDARRKERKQEKDQKGPRDPAAVDPDIAHIVPGPQPKIEE
jgi:hypothetical protein